MPRWDAAAGAPFVRFTVPALELRRLLLEARAAAAASNTSFDLRYTRLSAGALALGGDAWRAHATGVAVRLTDDDGRGGGRCDSRDESDGAAARSFRAQLRRAAGGGWVPCGDDELARLPPPSALALKWSLFYPLAIVPGATEVVCNY